MRALARSGGAVASCWLFALVGCLEDSDSRTLVACGRAGEAVDVRTDARNCGGCGHACGLGSACVAGVCVCSAPGSTDACGDCRNLSNDETSCGSCDHACGPGESCREGVCRCLRDDLMTNPAHCGECGHRCGPEQRCVAGRCACERSVETACESECADLSTDRWHCGRCDLQCPIAAVGCVAGRCVCPGARGAVCEGACADLAVSQIHCGACGRHCGEGARCITGSCVPRSVGPLPGAIVATARPTFRWSVPTPSPLRVQVCAERACARVVAEFPAEGSSVRATAPLGPGVYFWRVGDGAAGVYGTVWPFAVTPSNAVSGTVVGSLSDVTGDGLGDLLVGAPAARAMRPLVGRRGMTPEPGPVLTDTQINFGLRISLTGDIDGDGRVEFAVGAPRTGAASLRLFHLDAAGAASEFGYVGTYPAATAGVGDVNGDGFADFVVGDPGAATLTLFEGNAAALLTGMSPVRGAVGTGFASSVAAAWDVDADDFTDVLVGAPDADAGRGAAYLYHGNTMGLGPPEPLARPGGVMRFGEEVASAGDVDGDGNADLLVGGRGSRAFVYLGGAPTGSLPVGIGAVTGPDVHAVAVGDVDGDGYADVLIPLPSAGRAALHLGGPAGTSTTPVALVDPSWSQATGPVAGVGDLDGDGCAEVAVGVSAMRLVRVFFGDATRPLSRSATVSDEALEGFGAVLGR